MCANHDLGAGVFFRTSARSSKDRRRIERNEKACLGLPMCGPDMQKKSRRGARNGPACMLSVLYDVTFKGGCTGIYRIEV